MRKFRSSSFRSIRSRVSRGYNAPGSNYGYNDYSDDAYDAAKDNWVPGDEPMNSSQRRENEMLDEEYRRYRYEMGQ